MPRPCTICAHAERAAIDASLAAGVAYRDIAGQFSVSKTAVARHATDHIAEAVAQSQAAKSEGAALDVVKQLREINAATRAILKEAQAARDGDLALKAVDRLQRQIELQAKLLGDLDERNVQQVNQVNQQVNLILAPAWQSVRSAILAALAPYPEARLAVAAALSGVAQPSQERIGVTP